MQKNYPILEFDPARKALIDPHRISKPIDIPEHCVLCFFDEVISKLSQSGRAKRIARQFTTMGSHQVYQIEFEGKPAALFHPCAGAPLSAALLEELIARGCNKFIACGGAGVLDSTIQVSEIIVPTVAVRDEGTSYHYLPPAREVEASPEAVLAIETVLKKHQISYRLAKTWTTDAVYRETPAKIKLRKSEGCAVVEMEAAAFFAVAKFRNVIFGQILYGGDDVGGKVWQSRNWTKETSTRERLFWLALQACLAI
ncbi:MAG: nucleoside phosphorylase [bacterium]